MRERRTNPEKKKQLDYEIVDPLQTELQNYRAETTYKSSVETSKASESLKKYVIEQERKYPPLYPVCAAYVSTRSPARIESTPADSSP